MVLSFFIHISPEHEKIVSIVEELRISTVNFYHKFAKKMGKKVTHWNGEMFHVKMGTYPNGEKPFNFLTKKILCYIPQPALTWWMNRFKNDEVIIKNRAENKGILGAFTTNKICSL